MRGLALALVTVRLGAATDTRLGDATDARLGVATDSASGVGSPQDDEQKIRALFARHQCRHMYLDVGSNLGVQIRKLFEPAKYPQASVLPVFDAVFGPSPHCQVCAIGIEPNPRHAPRHQKLVLKLRQSGAGVVMLPAAAGMIDGQTTLRLGPQMSAFEDAGASIAGTSRGSHSIPVRVLSLARVIRLVRSLLNSGGRGGQILMKLDIEGAEWALLPDLMASGAICEVDRIFIEYHGSDFGRAASWAKNSVMRDGNQLMAHMIERIKAALPAAEGSSDFAFKRAKPWRARTACPTTILDMDDESYVHDGAPWPVGSICKTNQSQAADLPGRQH